MKLFTAGKGRLATLRLISGDVVEVAEAVEVAGVVGYLKTAFSTEVNQSCLISSIILSASSITWLIWAEFNVGGAYI